MFCCYWCFQCDENVTAPREALLHLLDDTMTGPRQAVFQAYNVHVASQWKYILHVCINSKQYVFFKNTHALKTYVKSDNT